MLVSETGRKNGMLDVDWNSCLERENTTNWHTAVSGGQAPPEEWFSCGNLAKTDSWGLSMGELLLRENLLSPQRIRQYLFCPIPMRVSFNVPGVTAEGLFPLAHAAAFWGRLEREMVTEDVLYLEGESRVLVAHVLAERNLLPESLMDEKLLRSETRIFEYPAGLSVAHLLGADGTLPARFRTFEILSLRDDCGDSVAHFMASTKSLNPDEIDDDLLRLENRFDETVAHMLARNGTLPAKHMSTEILALRDDMGRTVADYARLAGIMSV